MKRNLILFCLKSCRISTFAQLILYVVVLLCFNYTFSQDIQIILPNKTNAFIGRTSNEELLISSMNGWVLYDGLETKVFDTNSFTGLKDHNIQSHFYNSSNGLIWFCTYQSLISFDPELESIQSIQLEKNGLLLDSDYYLFHLENDTIYGSVGNELFVYDLKSGKTNFTGLILRNNWAKFYRINSEIHLISYFRKSTTVHYTLNREFKLKSTKILPFRTDDVCLNSSGTALLATNDGIQEYDLIKKNLQANRYSELSQKVMFSIACLSDNLWICSDDQGSLFLIDENRVKKISDLIEGNPRVQHIWNFDEVLIFSSYGEGVFLFSKNLLHFDRTKLPFEYHPSQVIQKNDELIFISQEYRPFSINMLTKKYKKQKFQAFERAMSLTAIPTGILVTTLEDNKRIFIEKADGNQIPLILPGIIQNVFHAQFHTNINKVSICTYSGHGYLGRIENQNFIIEYEIGPEENSKGIGYMICEKDWLITSVNEQYSVLYVKKGDKYYQLKKLDIKGVINMYSIDSRRNCTWIASQYGMYKLNHANFQLQQINPENSQSEIKSLLMDSLGRLWFSTADGLFLNLPESGSIQKFGLQDGINSIDFSSKTAAQLQSGTFLFGGPFGWVEFNPLDLDLKVEKPRIKMKKILFNDNVPVNLYENASLNLTYDINAISFDFAGTSLLNGIDNRLKYRLYPQDEAYLETGSATGFARYSHLNPGEYQFQILAADASGVWGVEPYTLDITVYPPWWETWWFRLIAIISLGAIIYYFVRDYYKRQIAKRDSQLREQKLIIEKQEAVQNERTRIAAEMHDDLGSGLTTIKYLSDKALRNVTDPEEIENIQQISEESNELVRNMSEIIWAMNARFDTLENLLVYIRRYAYEFLDQHDIDMDLDIPDIIPELKISGEKRRNIFLVVKEALHNVVKHSGSKSARIKVSISENLEIQIEDFGNKKSGSPGSGFGNGLHNMQQRMKKIDGTCGFHEGEGWVVRLQLPLRAFQALNTDDNEPN